METNPNTTQGSPAQTEHISKPNYNRAEMAEIVKHLTDNLLAPEYILLFGSLVGGTPHSDAIAYDLLIVVRETPAFDWMRVKRFVRYKMPLRRREVSYINLYIVTLNYVESNNTPFLYFTHSEGELVYRGEYGRFRSKRPCDFTAAYAEAACFFDTFHALGMEYTQLARYELGEKRNLRLASLFSAQAAVCFYRVLYYVYHGMEFDSHDPVVMHERMRTLSTELMLALDEDHIEKVFTLPFLKKSLFRAHADRSFDVSSQEAEVHMKRVERMGEVIARHCRERLELYKALSGR